MYKLIPRNYRPQHLRRIIANVPVNETTEAEQIVEKCKPSPEASTNKKSTLKTNPFTKLLRRVRLVKFTENFVGELHVLWLLLPASNLSISISH